MRRPRQEGPRGPANGGALAATASSVLRILQRLLFALAFLGAVSLAPTARAQGGDVAGWTTESEPPPLPEPPEGYLTEERGHVRWVYPDGAAYEMEALAERVADDWATLEGDLGVDVDDTLEVRIVRNPDEMRELAPSWAPPPAYASGVAYGDLGLILLSLTVPDTWERPDVETVFVHELSHIALRRAVAGHPLPRWFVEGVAIQQSGERSLERVKTLWEGHFGDRLIPLGQLDRSFPAQAHEVNLAYAQAADLVRYLRRDARSGRRFQTLVGELAEGETFEKALSDAYAVTPGQFERDWLASVSERARALPLIVGGGTFWVIAALLLVAAWRRRRKQAKAKLATMAAEEREHDEALASLEALAEARLRDLASQDDEGFVVYLASNPGPREQDVPTVEHDGHHHTLH
ncbi:MAG: hypothetical protein CMN30_00025 [Sandaracinus sp.]|nr:hypothetical protein [Sandaracinus sp.]